jgi:HK97 gp10 family phage protein
VATQVIGADKLKRKLAAFPGMARQQIAKAMEQSAQEMVDLAKALVPVDQGALRASIGWSWHGAPAGSMVLGEIRSVGRGAGNLSIVIYAGDDRAFYARFQEFGTSTSAARPYFFPAYRALRKRIRGRTTRAVRNAARAAAAGGQ